MVEEDEIISSQERKKRNERRQLIDLNSNESKKNNKSKEKTKPRVQQFEVKIPEEEEKKKEKQTNHDETRPFHSQFWWIDFFSEYLTATAMPNKWMNESIATHTHIQQVRTKCRESFSLCWNFFKFSKLSIKTNLYCNS